MAEYPSDKADQYMVRFPSGMRERLKDDAARNNRSLNAEIVARLVQTLDGDAERIVIELRYIRMLAEHKQLRQLLEQMNPDELKKLAPPDAEGEEILSLRIALRLAKALEDAMQVMIDDPTIAARSAAQLYEK